MYILCYRITNPVGRCEDLINRNDLKPGRFKLHFDTDRYFNLRNQDTIFPFIEVGIGFTHT